MAWNPLEDILSIAKTVGGLALDAATLLRRALRGDFDKELLEEMWEDAKGSLPEQRRVAMAAALVAVVAAIGPVTNSIIGTKLTAAMNTSVGLAIADAMRWADNIKTRVEKEAQRIKGNLDWERISATYQNLQIAHNIGLEFSPSYREAVDDFYRNTSDLSRQVFGPANSLFHGLSLLQLVVNDTNRINGRTAADGQAEFLISATNAAQEVADRSSAYARDGAKFWGDFQLAHIQPQIDAQYSGQIQRDSLIGRIDTMASAARDRVSAVSDRFTEYTQHLDPFLSDDNIESMEAIQRDFDRDIRRPVERFEGFMEETFPDIVEVTEQLAADDKVLGEGVLESLDRTAYPGSLTADQQVEQGLRINSIMDNAFVRGDGAPRTIQRDMDIVRSIYDILEAR